MNPELTTALAFARGERYAVLSTVTPAGEPESALMGIAVSPDFEIVFDTVKSSRKYPNLSANSHVSLVVGCTGMTTIQYEGVAEELKDEALEKYLLVYFAVFPDGVERRNWPGMTYFVVHPKWVRYCDYSGQPLVRREFAF